MEILWMFGYVALILILCKSERKRDRIYNKSVCPECGLPYSDWFVWDGERYCYPCWAKTGEVLKERCN